MRVALIFFLAQYSINFLVAQNPIIIKDTTLEIQNHFKFNNTLETPDGKVYAIGNTDGSDVDGIIFIFDPLQANRIVKLDYKGSAGEDVLLDHIMLHDGTFLLGGYHKTPGDRFRKAWLIRTDESGREINGSFLDLPSYKENAIYQIELTLEGDIVIAGEVNTQPGRVWTTFFSSREHSREVFIGNGELGPVKCMKPLPNGYLVMTGNLNGTQKASEGHVWVKIIDEQGREKHSAIIADKNWKEPEQLAIDANDNIYIAGKIHKNGKNAWDFWLTCLTPSLETIYSKTYGDVNDDQLYSITLLDNRYLALSGATYEHSTMALETQAAIFFVDLEGKRIQTDYAGNKFDDKWHQIIYYHDGSIITLGQQGTRKEAKKIWIRQMTPPIPQRTLTVGKTPSDLATNDFRVESVVYKDYDGNSILSSGEKGWIEITVINTGSEDPHLELSSQLRNPNLGVRLTHGEKTYASLRPKNTKTIIRIPLDGKANLSKGTQYIDITITNKIVSEKVSCYIKTSSLKAEYKTEILPEIEVDKNGRGVSVNQNFLLKLKSRTPIRISEKNTIILHEGVLIQSPKNEDNPIIFSCDPVGTGFVINYKRWIRLKPGVNKFEAFIVDESGDTIAYMEPIEIILVSEKIPNLHLVAIGPPHNNLSTDKDAADFVDRFNKQSGEIFGNIFPYLYNQANNTSYFGIVKIFRDLQKKFSASPQRVDNIKPGDVVMVYISTHGYTGPDSVFYIAPMDVDWTEKMPLVNYKIDILEPLQRLADSCIVIVLIDACHSGGAKSGPLDDSRMLEKIWEDLRQHAPGIITIASSKAGQYSQDMHDKKQGAFTYAVFEAFDDILIKDDKNNILRADQNDDNFLNLQELFDFLSVRVPMLTRQTPLGIQEPVIPKMQGSLDKIHIYKIKK